MKLELKTEYSTFMCFLGKFSISNVTNVTKAWNEKIFETTNMNIEQVKKG